MTGRVRRFNCCDPVSLPRLELTLPALAATIML
jgi:hypothetical protein